MTNDYLSDVFGAGGYLASRTPGYEMREGQVQLARMVDTAMRDGLACLGEGACGVGKSYAHLVPAIWHAVHGGKRTVVVTASILLQEQLTKKDLPALAEVLPWKFKYALLKGRQNYACADRIAEGELRGEYRGQQEHQPQIDDVLSWAKSTKTGDVSELPFVPSPAVWPRFSVSADACKGSKCHYRENCFANAAKAKADAADIVVTNYHLLFAHLALKKESGLDLVLPAFDSVVCDEAHAAPDIGREFVGITLGEYTFTRIASTAVEFGLTRGAAKLRALARDLFDRIGRFARSPRYRRRLKAPGFVTIEGIQQVLREIVLSLEEVTARPELPSRARAAAEHAIRTASRASERLHTVVQQSDESQVYWIELDAKGRAKLRSKAIEVGDFLTEELFDAYPSVSLVSATLAMDGDFSFIRREMGVPDEALELAVPGPFDYATRALLVVPSGLPEPRDDAFVNAVGTVFKDVIATSAGRALGLFTSHKNLAAVHERLRDSPYRILRQGELPRAELVRLFKEDVSSVLLGAESFWTGVDVPGNALVAVIIDKLPFASPDDPVIDALTERDPRAFFHHLVPRAAIALKQAVGRLLRRNTDYGVVVLCDRRAVEKAYGRTLLASLPPIPCSRDLGHIGVFLFDVEHEERGAA